MFMAARLKGGVRPQAMTMEIQAEHHVDAGEKNANGYYDYYYAYTDFVVELNGLRAGFRLYDNEPTLIITWIEDNGDKKSVKWGQSYGAIAFPRESVPMKEVLRYFRDTYAVRAVKAYDGPTGAYSAVAIEELV